MLFICWVQQEKQKAVLNELVGKLTDVCWDKCITGTPGSKFSSGESSCLTNCAQRFLETSSLILRRFQSLQQWCCYPVLELMESLPHQKFSRWAFSETNSLQICFAFSQSWIVHTAITTQISLGVALSFYNKFSNKSQSIFHTVWGILWIGVILWLHTMIMDEIQEVLLQEGSIFARRHSHGQ